MEDEWERQLESDEDLDLLFVTYDPPRLALADLLAAIKEQGFTVEVRDER